MKTEMTMNKWLPVSWKGQRTLSSLRVKKVWINIFSLPHMPNRMYQCWGMQKKRDWCYWTGVPHLALPCACHCDAILAIHSRLPGIVGFPNEGTSAPLLPFPTSGLEQVLQHLPLPGPSGHGGGMPPLRVGREQLCTVCSCIFRALSSHAQKLCCYKIEKASAISTFSQSPVASW